MAKPFTQKPFTFSEWHCLQQRQQRRRGLRARRIGLGVGQLHGDDSGRNPQMALGNLHDGGGGGRLFLGEKETEAAVGCYFWETKRRRAHETSLARQRLCELTYFLNISPTKEQENDNKTKKEKTTYVHKGGAGTGAGTIGSTIRIGRQYETKVWTALAHSFGSVSQNRQLQLYIELQELKKNDLSISEYLHKAKSLSDELSTAGKLVSPTKFNAIIYQNIGSDYHSIITALNLLQEPVSFSELHSQLMAREILLNEFLYDAAHQSSTSADVSTLWLSLSHSATHLDSPSTSGLSPSHTSSTQSPSPTISQSLAPTSHPPSSSPTTTYYLRTPSPTSTPIITKTLSSTSPKSTSSNSPILS
ncbi:hypothetical protein RJ639_020551 [Escallonia herrerae]|uniref:UBN2_3 domain-containing protein n=1 Tax=Escallonia herrerae TaxID=1293975 RepID=A0AA89AEP3_9ASTE|nr:hypothetical protein RJ639_020551 [Escallonia herrerae]